MASLHLETSLFAIFLRPNTWFGAIYVLHQDRRHRGLHLVTAMPASHAVPLVSEAALRAALGARIRFQRANNRLDFLRREHALRHENVDQYSQVQPELFILLFQG